MVILHRAYLEVLCQFVCVQVRALYDDGGKLVSEAGPSFPIQVRNLDTATSVFPHYI